MPSADERASGGALRHGARVVVRAGQPTPEELAALVAALDASAAGQADERRRPVSGPAWQRAARLEAAGVGRLATPADLAQAEARR